jgi:formylglycine-generating enzyme required for sulfatase activity
MDFTGDCVVDFEDFVVFAEQWLDKGIPDPDGMVWVSINDPGIGGGRVDFNGEMSKYETTNAQYCQFLNAALASGDITVDANDVIGANGTNTGEDFVGTQYYDLAGAGHDGSGATNGGAARIHYNGGVFSVDSGFENHPVTYVNWYGATAFCNYYGYRLPTEWEWQAVADYTGSYTYGCGTTINNSIANYNGSYHPNGTTAVGAFGVYGYGMCDMAGNVFEWTSSCYYDYIDIRSIRGGSWDWGSIDCRVSGDGEWGHWAHYAVDASYSIGFRACRGAAPVQSIVPNVIDMTQAQAEAAIAAAGLVVGTLTEEYSDTVVAGNIISQYPYVGEEFQPGSTVNLVVSKGAPIVWVSINDPGVSGHEGFDGEMSKHETTNTQYCEFLNAALASGDIIVDGNWVYGDNGSNSGADFAGQRYYNLAGAGYTDNGATNGGAARINYSGGIFTVDSGFENHPVTYVTWYGATAFCNYYGYRLPTEWEWQAVADYNGSYTYGCGTTINNSMANYDGSTHPDGTTAVGAFGDYGYGMCDMAGNVWEWTSTVIYDVSRVIRGGGWYYDDTFCIVSSWNYYDPYDSISIVGFRVCR